MAVTAPVAGGVRSESATEVVCEAAMETVTYGLWGLDFEADFEAPSMKTVVRLWNAGGISMLSRASQGMIRCHKSHTLPMAQLQEAKPSVPALGLPRL